MSLNKRIGDGLENDSKKIKRVYTGEVQNKELRAKLERELGRLEEVLNNPGCLNILLGLNICGRCMLRFIGLRDFTIYRLSSEAIIEILSAHSATLKSSIDIAASKTQLHSDPGYICTACVGTVQHAEDFVSSIFEYITKENYDVKTFNMNVTLPPSTLIRNHSIGIFWDQILSSKPKDQVDIKEIFKMLISWPIQEETGMTLDFSSELKIQVSIMHEETKDDHVFLSKMKESGMVIKTKRENRKTIVVGDGRHNIVRALGCVTDSRFASVGNVPPNQVTTKPEIQSIEMMRESIYLGGRYLKFSRDVSQTPWIVGTTFLTELSVSGTVCPSIKDSYRADDFKFTTAGREDANVRMLGNGRPFYIELINPRVSSQPSDVIKTLETTINNILPEKVQIRSLQSITFDDTKVIKDGEETKTKSYSALCWTSDPVNQAMIDAVNKFNDKPFHVEQQTPIRVLQRRAQMIRRKEIHSLKAFPLEGHFMVVHLHTEAGTYIKEFVHGDLGRNQPSLASIIGCETDIMELDVLEVDLDFPPSSS